MLILRLYSDIPVGLKPVGIPDEWPAEVQVQADGQPVPAGFVEITPEALETYKQDRLAQYEAWHSAANLPAVKEAHFAAVDAKTAQLIEAGFEFGGKRFSLSLNAQSTYSGLYMIREEPALTFPVVINTIDDSDVLPLTTAQEIRTFYLTAVATYRYHLDAGTALKNSIREATTAAEVEAIVDSR